MGNDIFDPNDPRIQLIIAKQQLKFNDELSTLKQLLETKKLELMFLQEKINTSAKKTSIKRGRIRFLTFLASMIFLSSTLLTGFGISILAATPPNQQGWFMIVLGTVTYLIGAIMTNLPAIGESD